MVQSKMKTAADQLASSKRVVVKVGSAILCDDAGNVRTAWLASLIADIAQMRGDGCEVIIVTSGAIMLGRVRLGLINSDVGASGYGPALRLDEKQASSAAGQAALAQAWQAAFEPHKIQIAQVLLTLDDTEDRRRYLNARATLRTLLELGAVPVINENDTVATTEIRYGDNDRLAAHAAQITDSDMLVILSDIDGLYTADPRMNPTAQHIEMIEAITPEIEQSATGPNKAAGVGSGGMASKIAAAKIAGANGCSVIIASGLNGHPIRAIHDGGNATLLCPAVNRENARRQWIAGRIKPTGVIVVDSGAVIAMQRGASLLPAGVVEVRGDFKRGDPVQIIGPEGDVLGQGLCAYDILDAQQICGVKSTEIEMILGYQRRPAIIEKDDLVLRGE